MWRPTVLLAAALAIPSHALHFFMDGAVQKCFYEELPKDTLVVGMEYPHLQEALLSIRCLGATRCQ